MTRRKLSNSDLVYLELDATHLPSKLPGHAAKILSLIAELKHLRKQLQALPDDTTVQELLDEIKLYEETGKDA